MFPDELRELKQELLAEQKRLDPATDIGAIADLSVRIEAIDVELRGGKVVKPSKRAAAPSPAPVPPTPASAAEVERAQIVMLKAKIHDLPDALSPEDVRRAVECGLELPEPTQWRFKNLLRESKAASAAVAG